MIVTDISSDRSIALEFVYVQGTPATIWEIEHNMNCHPGVTVIDSGKIRLRDRSPMIL